MANYYIFADTGSPLGDGSWENPWADSAQVNAFTSAVDGDIFYFGNGYYTPLIPAFSGVVNKITLRNFGNATPIFMSAVIDTGFSKTGGYTNVYEKTYAGETVYGVFEDTDKYYQGPSADIAEVDANASTWYWDAGSETVYFHCSDSADPATHDMWINLQDSPAIGAFGANNLIFDGLTAQYSSAGIGVAFCDGSIIQNCITRYMMSPGFLNFAATNCVIQNSESHDCFCLFLYTSGSGNKYDNLILHDTPLFAVYAVDCTDHQIILNSSTYGVSILYGTQTIQIDSGDCGVSFYNCEFENTSLRISGACGTSALLRLNNCELHNITSSQAMGTDAGRIILENNCIFHDISTPVASTFQFNNSSEINITNCKFYDISTEFFMLFGSITGPSIFKDNLIYDISGTNTYGLTITAPSVVSIEYNDFIEIPHTTIYWEALASVALKCNNFKIPNNKLALNGFSSGLSASDRNVYDLTAGGRCAFIDGVLKVTLADFQALGYDANSQSGDIKFVESLDGSEYYLDPTSPAIDLSDEPVWVSGLGNRYTGYEPDTGMTDAGYHYPIPREEITTMVMDVHRRAIWARNTLGEDIALAATDEGLLKTTATFSGTIAAIRSDPDNLCYKFESTLASALSDEEYDLHSILTAKYTAINPVKVRDFFVRFEKEGSADGSIKVTTDGVEGESITFKESEGLALTGLDIDSFKVTVPEAGAFLEFWCQGYETD